MYVGFTKTLTVFLYFFQNHQWLAFNVFNKLRIARSEFRWLLRLISVYYINQLFQFYSTSCEEYLWTNVNRTKPNGTTLNSKSENWNKPDHRFNQKSKPISRNDINFKNITMLEMLTKICREHTHTQNKFSKGLHIIKMNAFQYNLSNI